MLPQTKEKREQLLTLVNESVQFHREVETLKDDIKNNGDVAVENFGLTKKQYNAVVKAALDKAKLEDTIEELATSVSEWEILIGDREAPEDTD